MSHSPALTLDDMTKCLGRYMESIGIDSRYIHIEYHPQHSSVTTSCSLLLPMYGIEMDHQAHRLVYGHARYTGLPFFELHDSTGYKLKRDFNTEIRTANDITTFLHHALRSTTILDRKVDRTLEQLDEILKILNTPPPPLPEAPPPKAPQKPIDPPKPSWWSWSK